MSYYYIIIYAINTMWGFMDKILVSVIVPIYKVEKFIEQCICSIVNQTYKNLEIILVDDGSPDLCPKICDEWKEKDNRIKVIHKENGGLVSARKAGLLDATGDYVLSVDGDDFIGEHLIENICKCAQENGNPDIIAFNCLHYFVDKKVPICNSCKEGLYCGYDLELVKKELLYSKKISSRNFGNFIYSLWSKAFRRDFILEYQLKVPNTISKGEDVAVAIPAIINCKKLYVANFNDYYYRANPNSIINSFNSKEIDQFKILVRFLREELDDRFDNQICVYVLNMSISYIVRLSKCAQNYKEFKKIINNNLDIGLHTQIKRAKIYMPTIKDRFLIFAMRKKWYRLIYYFANKIC